MLEAGDWIVTRLNGKADDTTITKPPITAWLSVLSFKASGVTPVARRRVSSASAWLTVLALMLCARRAFSPTVAVPAGAVLSLTFGFVLAGPPGLADRRIETVGEMAGEALDQTSADLRGASPPCCSTW